MRKIKSISAHNRFPAPASSAQTVSQATLSIKVKWIFTNITKVQSLLFNLIYLSVHFCKDLRLCRLSIWISFICTPTFLILLLNPAIAASSAKRRFSVLWNIVALKNDFSQLQNTNGKVAVREHFRSLLTGYSKILSCDEIPLKISWGWFLTIYFDPVDVFVRVAALFIDCGFDLKSQPTTILFWNCILSSSQYWWQGKWPIENNN